MMSLEEALAQAELISDDENWVRIEKYPYKSFYEDEEETFIDVEKREISDPSKNVSTLGENNSQLITFVMDRYADGVDLVDMLIQIQYKLQSGEEATAGPVNVYASDDKIKFGWAISNIQTQVAQTIQFIVYCTGRLADNESYLLKTKPMSYRIENTLGTGGYIEEPSDEWFLQFEETMNQKMNQVATLANSAIDSAAGARESEQNATQSASTASTLASQVQSNTIQAKASEDAAKVSEQNAKASEDAARVYAGNASAVANVQIGTSDTAGLLRGGDIHVDESGALKMITPTETTMPNSYNGRLLVEEIGGVCEQNTTSGKNLVDFSKGISLTGGGVTYTVQPDGSYKRTGTVTNSIGNIWILGNYIATPDESHTIIHLEVGKTYYVKDCLLFSGTIPLGTSYNADNIIAIDKTRYPNGIDVTGIRNVQFGNVGVTYNDMVYPMVCEASEAVEWEPYTGGIPSPNPSYPQEIKKTVVSEIRTHGKNLFDVSKFVTNQYISGDGSVSANGAWGTSDYMMAKSPSVTISHKDTQWFQLVIAEYDSKKTFIRTTSKQGFLTSVTQELSENTSYIRISYSIDVGNGVFEREEVMINEGTTALPYEPYTESSITLSQPIELYGIGDVQDVIEDGKVKRNFKAIKVTDFRNISNSEDTNWYDANKSYSYELKACNYPIIDAGSILDLCTHFKTYNFYEFYNKGIENGVLSSQSYMVVNISKSLGICKTVDEFRQWCVDNDVTFVKELATPTTEELPLTDQIALNSLSTYDGITYLEFDSEIEPTFKGKYGTSEVGGYTLEALLTARNNELRIAAIETAGEEV